jgi:hypothetical protein
MPRKVTTGSESQRERMCRYRERQRALGRPEAGAVDVAVAAAVAGHAAVAAADPSVDPTVLRGLLRDAVDRLVASGNTKAEARRKVVQRVGRFSNTIPGGEPGR